MLPTVQMVVKLHPAQAAFRRSNALYRGFVGGRGSGKSWAISYDLIRRARRGRLYLMASPTYTILADTDFRTFKEVARSLGVLDPDRVKMSPPSISLTTGAEVIFRSADDPERLRGPNLSGAVLNEASLMHKDAYDIVIACLREGGECGWLSAGFTPKGVSHWTFDVFGKDRADTELFHAHTRDNPFNAPEFAATLARQYGAGALSDQELAGRFIDDDEAKVIPAAWVRAAQERWQHLHRTRPGPPAGVRLSAVGIDPARGGKDQTVLAKRYGTWFAPLIRRPGSATPDGDAVAALAAIAIAENTSALVNVDAVGIGSSPYDACRRLLKGARICAILSGNSIDATDRAGILRFVNVRAFAYWSLRELLDPANKHNVALPPDPDLLADLSAPRWLMTASGIKVEPKDDIIKRIGRSPDCGDAVVYSILLPPVQGTGTAAPYLRVT